MEKIKVIPYEQIEQKNKLEHALFSKLTDRERRGMKASWLKLLDKILASNRVRFKN